MMGLFKKKINQGGAWLDKKTGEKLLSCPCCGIRMKKLKKKDVVVDVCGKCGGMWMDFGEMEKLAAMSAEAKKAADTKKVDGTKRSAKD